MKLHPADLTASKDSSAPSRARTIHSLSPRTLCGLQEVCLRARACESMGVHTCEAISFIPAELGNTLHVATHMCSNAHTVKVTINQYDTLIVL